MFGVRNYSGVCAYACRHPQVAAYIASTMSAIRPWVANGQLQSVTIVVLLVKSRRVVARYVYDLSAGTGASDDAAVATLDAALRGHVVRLLAVGGVDMGDVANLHNATSNADDVPVAEPAAGGKDELTFDVLASTAGVPVPVNWTSVDMLSPEVHGMRDAVVTPIKDGAAVDTDPIVVTSRVEREAEHLN